MTFDAPESAGAPAGGDEPPPGRELATLLAEGIQRRGLRVRGAVDQHDSYGWDFAVEVTENESVWCMLQLSDNWLVITKPERSLLKRLFGPRFDAAAHRRVCEALHEAASEISNVSNVRWFSEEELHAQAVGSDHP